MESERGQSEGGEREETLTQRKEEKKRVETMTFFSSSLHSQSANHHGSNSLQVLSLTVRMTSFWRDESEEGRGGGKREREGGGPRKRQRNTHRHTLTYT